MRLLGNLFLRSISIAFGLLLAMLAAGLFISYGLHTTSGFSDIDDTFSPYTVAAGGFVVAAFSGHLALGPALVLIILAEIFRLQSLVWNVTLGGATALVAGASGIEDGLQIASTDLAGDSFSNGSALVLLSAGFSGGFVYWMIAGRRAGQWLGRTKQTISEQV